MKNKLVQILLIIVIAPLLLMGCVKKSASPRTDIRALLDKGRTYYNEGIQQEANITILQRKAELTRNTFMTGAKDLIANKASCFKDVAATEQAIAEAVMSNQNSDAIFSALVTQSVSGEQATSECVQLNKQLADYIITGRPAVMNADLAGFEAATKYQAFLTGFPEIDIMNDLMQTYGDTALIYQKLADNGIGVTDWTWLPTANLIVSHGDENLCRYYISGEFMQNVSYSTKLKFTGHEDALARLYESSWNSAANQGRGECRMTRYAALEYMTRPILSSDTQNVIESGEDQSIFPTDTP